MERWGRSLFTMSTCTPPVACPRFRALLGCAITQRWPSTATVDQPPALPVVEVATAEEAVLANGVSSWQVLQPITSRNFAGVLTSHALPARRERGATRLYEQHVRAKQAWGRPSWR